MRTARRASRLLLSALVVSGAAEAQVCYRLPFSNPDLADGWGSTCCGRSSPHRGLDFPQPVGTAIPAVAAGVVRISERTGCLGNAVVIEHGDGMFSGYGHMNALSPLGVGASVAIGQTVGFVGNTGSCTTGPHVHVTISNSAAGYSAGWYATATVNPYTYITSHTACAPSCQHRVDPFGWNCGGAIAGMTCTSINEAADPDTWTDNYFCSDLDRGIRWSNHGPMTGMNCIAVNESSEPASHSWDDNYLCAPPWLPYRFQFSAAGPIAGANCLQWDEPADSHAWNDNYLCWTRDPQCGRRAGPFAWSCAGPVDGMRCTAVNESSDPHTWNDNHLCTTEDSLGLRWSSAGPIADMDCTAITEGSEPAEHTWNDNFLCLPRGSSYRFRWSSAGPIAGLDCLQWYEPGDPHTWEDNFLCWQYTPPARDAAVDAIVADVTASTDVRVDVAAAVDASAPDVATPDAEPLDAGDNPSAVTGGLDCGCRVPRNAPRAPWAPLGVLALARRISCNRRKGRAS